MQVAVSSELCVAEFSQELHGQTAGEFLRLCTFFWWVCSPRKRAERQVT